MIFHKLALSTSGGYGAGIIHENMITLAELVSTYNFKQQCNMPTTMDLDDKTFKTFLKFNLNLHN